MVCRCRYPHFDVNPGTSAFVDELSGGLDPSLIQVKVRAHPPAYVEIWYHDPNSDQNDLDDIVAAAKAVWGVDPVQAQVRGDLDAPAFSTEA